MSNGRNKVGWFKTLSHDNEPISPQICRRFSTFYFLSTLTSLVTSLAFHSRNSIVGK